MRVGDLSEDVKELKDAQIEDVVELLLKTWKMRPPCAMISIPSMSSEAAARAGAGGKDGEERLISQQLELVIRRGLAEAVAKTDAWVFTSGDGSSRLISSLAVQWRTAAPSSRANPLLQSA